MLKSILLVVVASALPTLAAAQPSGPLTVATKAQFDMITGNVTRAADRMSEADYTFAPTPEVRSFGRLLGHIANASYMLCSSAAGEKNPSPGDAEKTATTKADITKALGAAFAYCDRVYATMSDATGTQMVTYVLGEQPRLAVLAFNNAHIMEHYGNVVTYMRMKGLVPPSSERR